MFNIKPTVKEIEYKDDNTYGQYVIEPLERGYGTTLGAVLRRTMLSSLPGTAISYIKIEGALHEFATLYGIKEDVTDIILNLKKVKIKNSSLGSGKKYGYINKSGKGVVTAGDIEVGGSLEIVNPELVIAHLGTDDAVFNAEIIITDGYGYTPSNEQKDIDLVEYIPIDSLYTPVTRVLPKVESSRVGQDINYDKLILEIHTNGSLSPRDAISMAGAIIADQMNIFKNYVPDEEKIDPFILNDTEDEMEDILNLPIDELDLSLRSYNALLNAGLNTIRDVVEHNEEEILMIKNMGQKSMEELKEKLDLISLKLRD